MFQIGRFSFSQNLCLLVLRLFMGGVLAFAWIEKIVDPASWENSLILNSYMQFIWVSVEVLAAVSLVFGVLSVLGAFLSLMLMLTSFVFYFLFGITHYMIYDKNLLLICSLLIISFTILIFGAGAFSIDRLIFGSKKR